MIYAQCSISQSSKTQQHQRSKTTKCHKITISFRRNFELRYKYLNNIKNNNNKKHQRKKKILNNETKDEEAMKKNVRFLKTLKTLKEYFNNRSIVILRNKEIAKKFITKSNRNFNDAEKKDEL